MTTKRMLCAGMVALVGGCAIGVIFSAIGIPQPGGLICGGLWGWYSFDIVDAFSDKK